METSETATAHERYQFWCQRCIKLSLLRFKQMTAYDCNCRCDRCSGPGPCALIEKEK